MLLAIDIGNSNIVMGLFHEDDLIAQKRVLTYASSQWRAAIQGFPQAQDIMIVSVVPQVERELREYLLEVGFSASRIFTTDDRSFETGVYFAQEGVNPAELGADLYVNAIANHHLLKNKCLSVDLGTASKFCVLEADGCYRGTTIVPGMRLALDALIEKAPLLPLIPFEPTAKVINTTTVACLQSGIFYGYCALVDGMIKRIKKEQGNLYVVLTGGIGAALHEYLCEIDQYIPNLTLQGARILYTIIAQ